MVPPPCAVYRSSAALHLLLPLYVAVLALTLVWCGASGDVIVCCWSGPANTAPAQGPAKGTISYWKRMAAQAGYGGKGFKNLN